MAGVLAGFRDRGVSPSSRAAFVELDRRCAEARRETHEDMLANASALANSMVRAGWQGRRLLICMPNGLDFVRAIAACLEAGVVAVPVSPARSPAQSQRLAHIARDADACAMLVATAERDRALPDSADFVVTIDRLGDGDCAIAAPTAERARDVAFVQYTSGSTGDPKGVEIGLDALLANLRALANAIDLRENDSALSWLPMFHDFGLVGGVYMPLRFGYEQSYLDPFGFIQRPARWLEAMHARRATLSGGPNFAYRAIVERVTPELAATFDLSAWRVASNGAEPVSADILTRFSRLLAPAGFKAEALMPCYGLAEATLFVTGRVSPDGHRTRAMPYEPDALATPDAPLDSMERRLVSSGPVSNDIPVRVMRRGCRSFADDGEVGEIIVGGPSLFAGYLGRPDATREAFLDGSDQRWLLTGDVGFLKDGELYVLGRIKDTIIVRGRNIYPADIEDAVATVIVGSRPNSVVAFACEGDHVDKGIVVLAESSTANLAREQLAGYETKARGAVGDLLQVSLAHLLLVRPHSLPRTSSGKPRRSASRELFTSGAVHDLLCTIED